jgi:predicted ATPase/class 3 adenylate cyclase
MMPTVRRDLPSGTVTFLFTDVEGSTRLLHELGADDYAEALAEHRRVIREAFTAHGGVEVDTQGDAFFVAFPTAPGALSAAGEMTKALASGPIQVRIGLHTGTPLVTEEGYVGGDIHRAARIAAAGHGGQVLVSSSTAQLVEVELTDLGQHRFKDLAAPERVFQLGDGEFPALKSLYRTNLPVPATPFLGRERELADVVELLEGARLLTLTGPGGNGKTRLAIQAAGLASDRFADGVWWVPLASLRDPKLVLETAAQILGSQNGLAEHISDKTMLLLLDNFEQVVEAAADLASLLSACPKLDLLVTSREPLHVTGEQEYPVPPLVHEEGVGFFLARVRAIRPDFQVDDTVSEICRRLDDLPLALELAAARAKALSSAQILERLDERLPLLTGGARDAPERQRTLRATIEWSYELLTSEEQRLFARLAVFSGGCTLEAAEGVAEADLDTLQSLVDKSLVRHTGERFWMLETIREYADERLEASDEADELRRRHAQFFLELAEAADLAGEVPPPQRREPLRVEMDNVRLALDWSLAEDPELGLRLAAALEGFWVVSNPIEAMRWFESLLERARDAPLELRANALRAYGSSANPAGRDDLAERAYADSLDAFRAVGDAGAAAVLLLRLGYSAFYRRDTTQARALAQESLAGFLASGNREGESQSLSLLGEVEYAEGKRDAGVELMEQGAALAGETGFTWWRAGMLGKLADCALERGHLDQAESHAREALALSRDLGDRLRIVRGLARLARIAAERDDSGRAGRLWGAVEAEEARGPIGAWENERGGFERPILAYAGAALDSGRGEGRKLALAEAVAFALDA